MIMEKSKTKCRTGFQANLVNEICCCAIAFAVVIFGVFSTHADAGKDGERRMETKSRYKEYRVAYVAEQGLGRLFGSGGVPVQKMEAALNEAVAEGWQVVFQLVERRRFLLFWRRRAVLITFGR